jgi:hypothetical protein
MVLPHHAGKFLPKTKVFFPHDFTLIASVVEESVIGHGIGGIIIPAKWRVSLRPDAGVSDDGLVCHHPISRPLKSVMAKRSTYVDITYYREFLMYRISTTSSIEGILRVTKISWST